MKLQTHPLAQHFPMMSGSALKELADDIKSHGLREPIVLHEGKIFDGRNRYEACLMAGVEPETCEASERYGWDGNPMALVRSLNLHRRHLTEAQRSMIAAELATFERGAKSSNPPVGGFSQKEAADAMKVPVRAVQRAVIVKKHGSKSLKRAVVNGKVSLGRAAVIAKFPKAKQALAAKQPPSKTVCGSYRAEPKPLPNPVIPASIPVVAADHASPVSLVEACYESNKATWNNPVNIPAPRKIVDAVIAALRAGGWK